MSTEFVSHGFSAEALKDGKSLPEATGIKLFETQSAKRIIDAVQKHVESDLYLKVGANDSAFKMDIHAYERAVGDVFSTVCIGLMSEIYRRAKEVKPDVELCASFACATQCTFIMSAMKMLMALVKQKGLVKLFTFQTNRKQRWETMASLSTAMLEFARNVRDIEEENLGYEPGSELF